ncbi:MAG TPA: ABC transporter ATP-binding protein [Nocardia sp.]|uniref:ABC transporter ATP-binding protein n=1 Tax=Nocardia TaxID=1817 RepID=UPI002456B196|nr:MULTISPECIES: ABC transporter ATP-binding protein [Nocardia]HLS78969.1 ABC transporter ATP-binding protein [Nocardia sp.]
MFRTVIGLLPAEQRGRVAGYLALNVVSTLVRAVAVVLVVPLVAELFGDDPGAAWRWVGLLTLAVAVGWVVDSIGYRIGFDLGFGILDNAQRSVAAQVARIPLRWFTEENSTTARRAIASTGPDLVGLVGYLLTPLIQGILLPIAIAIALVPIAWQLGLVALLAVPLLLGSLWGANRISRQADRVAADANSALTARIIEFARTQAALRAARRVEPATSQAGAALAAQHGATLRLLLLSIPGQLLFTVAAQIALLAMAGTTAWLAVEGTIGIPEAIALIVVVVRFVEPFNSIRDLAPAMETSRSALADIRTVIDTPGPESGGRTAEVAESAAAVELRSVRFGYREDGDEPVLDGLDIEFRAGEVTAIVGPSGAGKSTVLSLVAGLEQPNAGSVRVGGVDLGELDAAHRAAVSSVVFQQPYLFAGTIKENVLSGNPEATEEQLAEALRLARVDEFAERLPDGLDTVVGEAGTALSGGERQRVSIARALLKPSSVLLVDEGTSALDAENEAAVVTAIGADPRGRTRIVVTHRLSTIAGADRVLFLDGGRVVEDGTVSELLDAGGRFAEFWRHQHDAADWRITADAVPAGRS